MTNSREHFARGTTPPDSCRDKHQRIGEHQPHRRHRASDNAPIQTALPNEASDYEWKRETGEVQSYQHNHSGSWLHIDPQGQFYDRQAQPVTREAALEQAGLSNNQQPAHDGQTHREVAQTLSTIKALVFKAHKPVCHASLWPEHRH